MSINYHLSAIRCPLYAHLRHFSSLFTNLPSTNVENSLQITPFYAKQSQFDGGPNEHKLRYEKQLQDIIPLAQAKKQSQFKANKAKNKPNLTQNKPNQSQFKANSKPICRKAKKGANLLVFARKTIYNSGKKNDSKSNGETVLNKFTRRDFLRITGISTAALMASRLTKASDKHRPTNIVIIIGDDIGYSDFGCYGGEIQTPNIDRIAAGGIRFTQFHSESMCAPTRVALLTGQYHIRGYNSGRNVTIAKVLSKAGYRSCAVGKWHNAGEPILNRKAPLERGFDNFFGTPQGCGSFFAPLTLSRDGKPAEDQWKKNKDFYYTDAISDNAVRYIKETPKETPLFLYTAYTAAHWPLHALPEDIEKQKGRYAMGWDRLRQQRIERMKKIGIVKPDTPLSPRHPNVPAWKDEKHKQWQQRRMEVYAAQITRMDKGIGQILKALKETNRLENTLIMVLVDNGGCHVEYKESRTGAFLNKQTRDGRKIKTGNRPDVMPGAEDTWQSYGYGWANASNTPFRMFKQYDHEGGICVPLIVHWPKVISNGGQITRQVCHVMDLLPTVMEAAGIKYPKTYNSRRINPADGKSMVPILRGQQRKKHEALFWKFSHGCAVRQGKWKLVRMDKKPWELYDIEADPVELTNLNRKYPDKAAQLEALWEKWYKNSAQKKPGKKKNRK